jgi:hypothetical protein
LPPVEAGSESLDRGRTCADTARETADFRCEKWHEQTHDAKGPEDPEVTELRQRHLRHEKTSRSDKPPEALWNARPARAANLSRRAPIAWEAATDRSVRSALRHRTGGQSVNASSIIWRRLRGCRNVEAPFTIACYHLAEGPRGHRSPGSTGEAAMKLSAPHRRSQPRCRVPNRRPPTSLSRSRTPGYARLERSLGVPMTRQSAAIVTSRPHSWVLQYGSVWHRSCIALFISGEI